MNLKRIIGIIVCIGGVVLIFISNYIKNQVAQGQEQISSAESNVKTGKTLFGANPVTKEVGNQLIFKPAENKIKAGKEEVAYYEALASKLLIGGIVVIIAGLGIVFIPFGKKKRSK